MTRATDRIADIHRVVVDDALLDRLGSGTDVLDDGPVEAMLQRWRAEWLLPALPAVPSGRVVRRATAWLKPDPRCSRRHRSWQAATGIAASIALLLGATTAIGSRTAHPGDPLWPVTELLWSDRADSVRAQQSAQHSLVEVRQALAVGDLPRARAALSSAATVLTKVESQDEHDLLQADLAAMADRLGVLSPAPSRASTGAAAASSSDDPSYARDQQAPAPLPATDPSTAADNTANAAGVPSDHSRHGAAPGPANSTSGAAESTHSAGTPSAPNQRPGSRPATSPKSEATQSESPPIATSSAPVNAPSVTARSSQPLSSPPSSSQPTTAPSSPPASVSAPAKPVPSTAPATSVPWTSQPTVPSMTKLSLTKPSATGPSATVSSVDGGSRSILPVPPPFAPTGTAAPESTTTAASDTASTDTAPASTAPTRAASMQTVRSTTSDATSANVPQ